MVVRRGGRVVLCRAMQWEPLSKEKRDQEPGGVMQQWELTGTR